MAFRVETNQIDLDLDLSDIVGKGHEFASIKYQGGQLTVANDLELTEKLTALDAELSSFLSSLEDKEEKELTMEEKIKQNNAIMEASKQNMENFMFAIYPHVKKEFWTDNLTFSQMTEIKSYLANELAKVKKKPTV